MKNLNYKRIFNWFLLLQSIVFYCQNLPIIGFSDATNYTIGYYSVPGSSGLDLHWHGGIRFGDRTGSSVMQITNGNVGIGTANPRANLDMAKDISNGQLGTVFGRLPEGDGSGLGTYLGVKGYATQGDDPYNVKSFSIVHDFYGQTNNSINFYRGGGVLGGFMTFNTSDNTEKMRIGTNGNVGIGTTTPDEKLTVKGKIHAQEVKVDMLGPLVPDYVFANDYKLKTLKEVEDYINKNSHLPEIPSAQEIEKNGLMLAEMNMLLLKKMEEMTLYIIEQNKISKELIRKVIVLEKALKKE
jgi:hypothetical protein